MTAVIAVFDSTTGKGAMAADNCWSGAYLTRSAPKIRRFGPMLVASAGAMAHLFLDQSAGRVYSPDEPGELAEKWREWCVDRHHYKHNDEHGLRQYPACFLILTPEGIWEIDDDGEACKLPPETTAAAIGIGALVCMGAAHALGSSVHTPDVADIAERAIDAAIDLCEGCRGPVQVCALGEG